MTTLVIGARGGIGRHVVDQLLAVGEPVRASVRDPRSGADLPAAVDVVTADLTRPDTLRPALDGVRRVFLYAPPASAEGFATVAAEAALERVVLLSSGSVLLPGMEHNAIAQEHRAVEAALSDAGLPWTPVRPLVLASNSLRWGGVDQVGRNGAAGPPRRRHSAGPRTRRRRRRGHGTGHRRRGRRHDRSDERGHADRTRTDLAAPSGGSDRAGDRQEAAYRGTVPGPGPRALRPLFRSGNRRCDLAVSFPGCDGRVAVHADRAKGTGPARPQFRAVGPRPRRGLRLRTHAAAPKPRHESSAISTSASRAGNAGRGVRPGAPRSSATSRKQRGEALANR